MLLYHYEHVWFNIGSDVGGEMFIADISYCHSQCIDCRQWIAGAAGLAADASLGSSGWLWLEL